MSICYNDNEIRKPFRSTTPYQDLDANRFYLTHFSNSLYLTFLATSSDNFAEKAQAKKELDIAETKMNHWKRHPNFNLEYITAECSKLKAKWR